jgi:hypothetical protein
MDSRSLRVVLKRDIDYIAVLRESPLLGVEQMTGPSKSTKALCHRAFRRSSRKMLRRRSCRSGAEAPSSALPCRNSARL